MEATKLGRCECRGSEGLGASDTRHAYQCPNDAVRMVTVQEPVYDAFDGEPLDASKDRDVPMCAACAEYHEKGGAK